MRTQARLSFTGGLLLAFAAVLAILAWAPLSQAAFPPAKNGRIAFAGSGATGLDIFSMSSDATGRANLTNAPMESETNPSYSPNGSLIVFSRQLATNRDLFVMNANGTGLVNLTNTGSDVDERHPAYSPDGSLIAFTSDLGTSDTDILLMNANGTAPVNLTNTLGDDETAPDFDPTGQKLVFALCSVGQCDIYAMNRDGSAKTNLTKTPAVDDPIRPSLRTAGRSPTSRMPGHSVRSGARTRTGPGSKI